MLLQTRSMPQGGNYETTAGHSNRTLADSIGSVFFCGKKVDTCDACFASPVLRIMKNQRYPKTAPLNRLRVFAGLRMQFPPMAKLSARLAYSSEYILGHSVPRQPRCYFGLVDTLIYFVCRAESFGEHIHSWFAGPFKSFLPVLFYEYIELSTKKWINFIFNPLLPFKE